MAACVHVFNKYFSNTTIFLIEILHDILRMKLNKEKFLKEVRSTDFNFNLDDLNENYKLVSNSFSKIKTKMRL